MKLSDLKSERLIPFQAHNEDEESIEARLTWVCNAFDDFVHTIDARRLALAAPYSLDAIRAMTDAELQQYFAEFGIAKYYPDIARSAREMMLYNEMRYFRKLGTVAAIEAMVQYIFGENPIDLTMKDCLAFDENGVLTDASLYDMYDVIITAENPVLGAFELGRIFANLTRFNRTTQKLRAITMRYSGGECTAYAGAGSVEYAVHYENWEICDNPPTPPVPKKYTRFMNESSFGDVFWREKQSYDVYLWDEKVNNNKWVRAKYDPSRVYPTSILIYRENGHTSGKTHPVAFSEDSYGLLVVTPADDTIYGAYFVL